MRYYTLALVSLLLLAMPVSAQLRADFFADKTGGCTPLLVAFRNTTTGASANATYQWNFGNNNTSVLQNPGAIYQQEQAYTVTLTVKDGGQVSSKSQIITVYKKPTVNFVASIDSGCLPLPVSFSANATPGDGTITTYAWDFGDGSTQQGYSGQVTHTYTATQIAPVSLTVTTSYGCYNTIIKPDLIKVKPELKSIFTADKKVLCKETDSVQFYNASTGPGTLSYLWDFGNGVTSTQKEPAYAFNKRGIYTIKLTVNSSEGCTATSTQGNSLNVASYSTNFSTPSLICRNSSQQFISNSTPRPDNMLWVIDGNPNYYSYGDLYTSFGTLGTHTIKLQNTFGTCIDSAVKQVVVKDFPNLQGFVADVTTECGAPVLVNFKDTTAGAVKWEWDFNYYNYGTMNVMSTVQAPSYTYTNDWNYSTHLRVTNADGCSSQTWKYVYINRPRPSITFTTTNNNYTSSCGPMTVYLKAVSTDSITKYQWNFGDGTTSTDIEPSHTYSNLGSYTVSLAYTTKNGCQGSTSYSSFKVMGHESADFKALNGTTICSGSFLTLQRIPNNYVTHEVWLFNGQYMVNGSSGSNYTVQLWDTGKYTITHIASNEGCRDTVTKVDYISVLSPYSKINRVTNTCDGTRGLVTFNPVSTDATQWNWNFGDGTTASYTTKQSVVTHTYTKTGKYKAYLTATKDQCTIKDSADVFVMIKQNPVLSSNKTTFCIDDGLTYTLTNLEANPYNDGGYWYSHYVDHYQFGDGTTLQSWGYYYDNRIHTMPYTGLIKNIPKGKEQIRVVTREIYFNCVDTSNYIPIKIMGAEAGFRVLTDKVCFTSPVVFKDTSKAHNTQIQSWQWDFGDGERQTYNQPGMTVTHLYANPGSYYVSLKVTDASGCTSSTSSYSTSVAVYGPKTAFGVSGTNVHLNTTVYFYNNTNNYGSYYTTYVWDFGDGATSTDYSPSHTYTVAGTYTATLTATNSATGCTSQVKQVIVVKVFNSAFSFSSSFVTATSCPPVVARFQNTSINYVRIKWDFGDGFIADNVNYPSHIYDKPGKYIITLFVYGPNGLTGQYTDSIFISTPLAQMSASLLQGCTAQSVTMSAVVKDVKDYWWDFGDGTIQPAVDSFATHKYTTAGIYNPRLIIRDSIGCTTAVNLSNNIVIDSIGVRINPLPAKVCTPKNIVFTANVTTAAPQNTVVYHWNFGTGLPADTSNLVNPSFSYTVPGKYIITLRVQSAYGCVKEVKDSIFVYEGLGGKINGPSEICEETEASFFGSTQLPGQPAWQWLFHDGTVVNNRIAPPKKYNDPGDYLIKLFVDNHGCIDTLIHTLTVHPKPTTILASHQFILCEGASTTLTASGGVSYVWSPATGLNTTTGNLVIASPVNTTLYKVSVTNNKGCTAEDSLTITVIHPFTLNLATSADVCKGSTIELKASDAATYQWIDNTGTLNSLSSPNPKATPASTTSYTVIGTDAQNCFKDTATIVVAVRPLPTVYAGIDAELLTGAAYQLVPTGSSDITNWTWSPSTFLSCTTCMSPETKPMDPMQYIVTAQNSFGCIAKDTVAINLLCAESRIYIPNTFTPNNDGKNDQFKISGQGIRIVKSFRIFNRWGELVFARTNFHLNDDANSWDGRYKGTMVMPGTYVYMAELSCNEHHYQQKGSITVVY